jgi:hypothetical protein
MAAMPRAQLPDFFIKSRLDSFIFITSVPDIATKSRLNKELAERG